MPIRNLSFDEVIDRLLNLRQPYLSDYLAMYSSWYGGIVTDPSLMMVPIDDHLINRGDGVFEVFKCVDWNMYALGRHLDRMKWGMEQLGLKCPVAPPNLIEIIRRTILAGNSGTCLTRLYVSRGPGGFSASPYESVANQLYVVVHALKPQSPEKRETGVSLVTSSIPMKPGFLANVKNCNYLPNVLMKKQAEDAGACFSVSIDENGFLGEGGRVSHPSFYAHFAGHHREPGVRTGSIPGRLGTDRRLPDRYHAGTGLRRGRDDGFRHFPGYPAHCRIRRPQDWRRTARSGFPKTARTSPRRSVEKQGDVHPGQTGMNRRKPSFRAGLNRSIDIDLRSPMKIQ